VTAHDEHLEEALRQIARIAGEVTGNGSTAPPAPATVPSADGDGDGGEAPGAGCRIMALPSRLRERAAQLATRVNPVNAPLLEPAIAADGIPPAPLSATITTGKYWGPKPKVLTVSFMEAAPADLRARIVGHLNAWSQWCGMRFTETSDTGDVRISREEEGYWSYLGTDVRLIPLNRPTMSLQGFTMSIRESEYRRVVRHEAGHTLGFPHEHMRKALVDRIDPQKAYAYFLRTQGWDEATVDQQVLTPLGPNTIIGTEPDMDSIMCYQLPGEITRDGRPIRGGADINQTDGAFAGVVYPKVLRSAEPAAAVDVRTQLPSPRTSSVPDWSPQEDVLVGP
jgi:hypothetical protein